MSEFAHRRTSEVSKISHPETPGETTETSPAKRRNWTPPVEQMPPAIQFALSVVEWFRKKCTAVEKEKAPLRMVGQLPLGGKRHLALVEVGNQQFLVGGGVDNITVIVPVAAQVALPDPMQARIAEGNSRL